MYFVLYLDTLKDFNFRFVHVIYYVNLKMYYICDFQIHLPLQRKRNVLMTRVF